MAWHDGTGPALKAVANSSGYAGKFEGPVTVSDSLTVEGMLRARGSVAVNETLAVRNGFMFSKDPVPGYVLRCADIWGNAEWVLRC